MLRMNSLLGKKILSLIRNGDYAHPGEEDAIDRVFENIPVKNNLNILDVGCGLGGTAAYLYRKVYGNLTGVDIDKETIEYASSLYPEIKFYFSDVVNVGNCIEMKYDLIYMLTAFYAFPDQLKALKAIRSVSKNNATMLIFDYTKGNNYRPEIPEIPNPIDLSEIEIMLKDSGWKTESIKDMSSYFLQAYKALIIKIQSKKADIVKMANEEFFNYMLKTYIRICDAYKYESIGGVLITAKANAAIEQTS